MALPPYRYPDVSVACGEAAFEKIGGIAVLTNPTLIVEVLSPESEGKEKRLAYQTIPHVMEYLLIAQNAPHITQFVRQSDMWIRSDCGDVNGSLTLPSLECVLSLRDVYVGVEFG